MVNETYTIEEHQHRLAAWAASRAASVVAYRFNVKQGVSILEASGFKAALSCADQLPLPVDMDRTHAKWREAIRAAARKEGLSFTHGVAAKLINVYLKVRFVCAGQHEHVSVRHLHPPIDATLLKKLGKANIGGFSRQWRKFQGQRWSKFSSSRYQSVIDLIRRSLGPGVPLWMIEEHWKGHQ